MKPHLLDQEVIDMILRHATECIGTDGVDGLRGHILTLTARLATIEAATVERCAAVCDALAADQSDRFDAYIAGGGEGPATSYAAFYRTAADAIRALAPLDTEAMGVRDEVGWLLERVDCKASTPLYHSLTEWYGTWVTLDHNKALRFARKEDAEAYIAAGFVGEDDYRAVEHMWCAPSSKRGGQ